MVSQQAWQGHGMVAPQPGSEKESERVSGCQYQREWESRVRVRVGGEGAVMLRIGTYVNQMIIRISSMMITQAMPLMWS